MKARENSILDKLLLPKPGEEALLIKQILIYNGYLYHILIMCQYHGYPQDVAIAEEIWVRNAKGPSFLHVNIHEKSTQNWSKMEAQEIFKLLADTRRVWGKTRECLVHQPLW